jgi:hypothetical protein
MSCKELYFGSKRVNLIEIDGNYQSVSLQQIKSVSKNDSKPINEDEPNVPGNEFEILNLDLDNSTIQWPSILKNPVIKTNIDVQSDKCVDCWAVASGVRSAIVEIGDGRFIRLKGCGNNDQGFIVNDQQQLRGCVS